MNIPFSRSLTYLTLSLVVPVSVSAAPALTDDAPPRMPTNFGTWEHIRVERIRGPWVNAPYELRFESAPVLPLEIIERGTGMYELRGGHLSPLLPKGFLTDVPPLQIIKRRVSAVSLPLPVSKEGIELHSRPQPIYISPRDWHPLVFKSKTNKEYYF